MMNSKKGQAAIEYIMDYSWALLLLAIVIGAIFFTGAFNPTQFVMKECYFGPQFKCNSQLIDRSPSTQLLINITNLHTYRIKLKNVSFSSDDLGTKLFSPTPATIINSSDSNLLDISFPKQSIKGEIKKILVNITYYICAEEVNPTCNETDSFQHIVSGRIVEQVS